MSLNDSEWRIIFTILDFKSSFILNLVWRKESLVDHLHYSLVLIFNPLSSLFWVYGSSMRAPPARMGGSRGVGTPGNCLVGSRPWPSPGIHNRPPSPPSSIASIGRQVVFLGVILITPWSRYWLRVVWQASPRGCACLRLRILKR